MPKRGDVQAFKIEFQYPGRPKYRRAYGSRSAAEYFGEDTAARGAWVRVFYRDPDTGDEVDLHTYDSEDTDQ